MYWGSAVGIAEAAAAKEAKEASDPLQLAATDTDMVWLQGDGAYK